MLRHVVVHAVCGGAGGTGGVRAGEQRPGVRRGHHNRNDPPPGALHGVKFRPLVRTTCTPCTRTPCMEGATGSESATGEGGDDVPGWERKMLRLAGASGRTIRHRPLPPRTARTDGAPPPASPEAEDAWRTDVVHATGPVAAYLVLLLVCGLAVSTGMRYNLLSPPPPPTQGVPWQAHAVVAANVPTAVFVLGAARVAVPRAVSVGGMVVVAGVTWVLVGWQAASAGVDCGWDVVGVTRGWHPLHTYVVAMEAILCVLIGVVACWGVCSDGRSR